MLQRTVFYAPLAMWRMQTRPFEALIVSLILAVMGAAGAIYAALVWFCATVFFIGAGLCGYVVEPTQEENNNG